MISDLAHRRSLLTTAPGFALVDTQSKPGLEEIACSRMALTCEPFEDGTGSAVRGSYDGLLPEPVYVVTPAGFEPGLEVRHALFLQGPEVRRRSVNLETQGIRPAALSIILRTPHVAHHSA